MGVMTSNIKERTTLATFRFVFAFAGSILVLATAEPLVAALSKTAKGINIGHGWQMSIIIYAVIAAVLFLLTFAWTRERIKPVSYTHLDVYKRQGEYNSKFYTCEKCMDGYYNQAKQVINRTNTITGKKYTDCLLYTSRCV